MKIINRTGYYTITTNVFNTFIDEDVLAVKILPLDTGNEKINEKVEFF